MIISTNNKLTKMRNVCIQKRIKNILDGTSLALYIRKCRRKKLTGHKINECQNNRNNKIIFEIYIETQMVSVNSC